MPRPTQDEPVTHLLRGSPVVPAWSRYPQTVPAWTLCGIRRERRKSREPAPGTEYAADVTCRYCRLLMGTPAKTPAKAGRKPQERAAAQA